MAKIIIFIIILLLLIKYAFWPLAVFLIKLLFGLTVGLIAVLLKVAFLLVLCALVYFGWKKLFP